METEQEAADAAEDRAISRLVPLRKARAPVWVRRCVAVALVGYLTLSLAMSAGPVQHRPPSCLVVPTLVKPSC